MNPGNQDDFCELGFGDQEYQRALDPPPSYDEVTRQPLPGVNITQQPSGDGTATGTEALDSSGLPSYTEALRLSQQSLGPNDTTTIENIT
jgi:hypothetical protein